MSLPTRQQRTLDGIAAALKVSEPRLAAMFTMFTRLTRDDASPWREQLPVVSLAARMLSLVRGRHRRNALRRSGGPLGESRPDSPAGRQPRPWLRILIIGQVAVAMVVCAVLIGLSSHPPAGCNRPVPVRIGIRTAAPALNCAASGRPHQQASTHKSGTRHHPARAA